MKNVIFANLIIFGLMVSSCKNNDKAGVVVSDKQEAIDSMKTVIEKQKVIDSMKIVAEKAKEKKEIIYVNRFVKENRSNSEQSVASTTTTKRKKGWSRAAKGADAGKREDRWRK